MKFRLSIFGIIISIASFAQSENTIFETFNKHFSNETDLSAKYEISSFISPQFLISDFNGIEKKILQF